MLLLFFLRGGDGIAETLTRDEEKSMRDTLDFCISHNIVCCKLKDYVNL